MPPQEIIPLTPEELSILAQDPEFDIFNEDHRSRLLPSEFQTLAELRQQQGSFGEGLKQTGREMVEGFKQLGEIDPIEALPSIGGTVGRFVPNPTGPIGGAAVGGGGGELLRQLLQGEDISGSGIMKEAALQSAPTALLKLAGPIMRTGVKVSPRGQAAMPEQVLGPRGIALKPVPSEKMTTDAMLRFDIRPGPAGAIRSSRLAAEAREGATRRGRTPAQARRGAQEFPIFDPDTRRFMRSPIQRNQFANEMDKLGAEMTRMEQVNVGGASVRDRLRLLLGQVTTPTASGLRELDRAGVDDLIRGMMGLDAAGFTDVPPSPTPEEAPPIDAFLQQLSDLLLSPSSDASAAPGARGFPARPFPQDGQAPTVWDILKSDVPGTALEEILSGLLLSPSSDASAVPGARRRALTP